MNRGQKLVLGLAILSGGLGVNHSALAAEMPDYFLNGTGARAGAMGGAFVAVADDVNGILYNPAGTAFAEKSQFTVMRHGYDLMDIETNHIGFLYKTGRKSSLGMSLTLATNDNNFFTSYGNIGGSARPVNTGTFSEKQTGMLLSYAQQMGERSAVGLTARYLSHKFPGSSDSGFGLDLGFLHNQSKNLKLGVNLQNIVPTSIGQDEIPFNLKIGGAYTTGGGDFTLAADLNTNANGSDDSSFNVGVEYRVMNSLKLRAGAENDEFSLGFGLEYDNWQVDYAYLDKELGNTSRLAFNYYPSTKDWAKKIVERAPTPIPPVVADTSEVIIDRLIEKKDGKDFETDVRVVVEGEVVVNLGVIDKISVGQSLQVLLNDKVSAMLTITDAGRFFSRAKVTDKAYQGNLNKGTLLGNKIIMIEAGSETTTEEKVEETGAVPAPVDGMGT